MAPKKGKGKGKTKKTVRTEDDRAHTPPVLDEPEVQDDIEGPIVHLPDLPAEDPAVVVVDGQAAAKSTGKSTDKRNKRPPVTLTEEQEQAVVEYLKENPILYNRKLKEYKDKTKRDACWRIMAERIGISTDDIKKWFQSMRTVYGKVTITKSGQAQAELTDRQKWVKSNFLFLGSFIARIGKTSGLKRGNSQTADEYSDVSRATSPEVEDTPPG